MWKRMWMDVPVPVDDDYDDYDELALCLPNS